MKSKRIDRWSVNITTAPTVEIDTEAGSAYVRFKRAKIARTLRHGSRWPIVTIDLDAHGQLVGLEFVGVKEFNLAYLLRRVRLKPRRPPLGEPITSRRRHTKSRPNRWIPQLPESSRPSHLRGVERACRRVAWRG
jgi:uncharacterized protein YuzE